MSKLIDWIEDRTGIRALARKAVDQPVPGGARVRYVFGAVLSYLFVQQVVLGILLASYYSPSATDAWASTAYIQDRVAAGWFLRGLHYHGSSAMVVVMVVHTLQVVIAGAYRKPREFNWWTGLILGGLVLALALSGYTLRWDQEGFWDTQVRAGIVSSVPLGEGVQKALQGGSDLGNLTLTRFYALHVFVLPLTFVLLVGAHLYLVRRHGVTPPARMSEEELARKTVPRWPNQLFIDVLAMTVTGGLLVVATYWTHGADLLAPADGASNFVARPNWFFLFLFQLLKYFHGPLTLIGTVLIPGAIATFLFALPFIDRSESRAPKKRMPVLGGVGLLMVGVVVLTTLALVEDANNEEFQKGAAEAKVDAARTRELAALGVPPEGGTAVWQNDPNYAAMALFKEHCSTCHMVDGRGGEEAPTLDRFNDRDWLRKAVREPQSKAYFGETKLHRDMEAYSAEDLPDDKLDAVVEYMIMLRDKPEGRTGDYDAALAKQGEALWADELDCSGCHLIEAGEDGDGAPVFLGRGSRAWIARVIHDASQVDIYGKEAEMPKFDGKLSDEEIENLANYIYTRGWPEAEPAPEATE